MPSEHSRSSSSSSATSVPTINVKYAPPPLKNATNQTNSTYNNEMLDISNGSSREKSPSRERNSRGKSPGRNNKRGKSPSLDPPKSPNSNRSRSPGNRSRSKSPRNKTENESPRNKSSQDVRVSLNLKAPWIAPSLKVSTGGKGNSSKNNRLSLPQNFSEFSINAIRESNKHWERLNNISSDSKDGGKSGMGNFSKPISFRIGSSIMRPKLSVDTNNSLHGGKPMQRNASGQLIGKSNDSPLLPAAGPPPLTRSRSYNSAMDDTHHVSTFSKNLEQYRLQHSWTMYYDSKPAMTPGPKTPTGEISYRENLQTIGTFDTVERFCRYFNWVKKPSQLSQNTNFHIFKDKIMPLWEDPANANGGKWVISLNNPQLLDRCWEWLVYSLVGEQLDENDDICGAVMSRRSRGDRIAIWVRDKDNTPVIHGIGRRLLKILDLQNENSIKMDFQVNEDALKSGTSYNNQTYLSLESLKKESEKAERESLEELSKMEKSKDEVEENIPETKTEKSKDEVDENIPESNVEKNKDEVDENIPEAKAEKSKDEVDENIPETSETKIEVAVTNSVATEVGVSINGEEKNCEKENEKN